MRSTGGAADHPRSRGVYACITHPMVVHPGSSPLARGLRERIQLSRPRGRIIPARAGFTAPPPTINITNQDHPRSRGVYVVGRRGKGNDHGSSPLARGLPRSPAPPGPSRRIIPARAGFTLLGTGSSCPGSDHPRSRGVYLAVEKYLRPSSGSSPLARGLLAGLWRRR